MSQRVLPPLAPSVLDALQVIVQSTLHSTHLLVMQMEHLPEHLHQVRLLHISDGSRLILKVSPPANVPLLRNERQYLETEALALSFLARSGLPIAKVLRHENSGRMLGSPFLLTTHLSGISFAESLPFLSRTDRLSVERQLSVLVSTISQHSSPVFGSVYLVSSNQGYRRWREAFRSMLESVLRDAEDMFVNLPYSQIREQLVKAEGSLDEVREARLVIPGLSDPGNVLVDRQTKEITGVMDFTRALWGDVELMKDGEEESVRSLL
ncbi:hypothetical protein MMC20_007107 [Loxospora ochrophaea]|nr:hypothetical protein [Loxospora ochrophaea]